MVGEIDNPRPFGVQSPKLLTFSPLQSHSAVKGEEVVVVASPFFSKTEAKQKQTAKEKVAEM